MTDKYKYIDIIYEFDNIDRIIKGYNLSVTQYKILLAIYKFDSDTTTKISTNLNIFPSAISRSLKPLEKKKLIQKKHGASGDQRVVRLEVTDNGKSLVDNIHSELNKKESNMYL